VRLSISAMRAGNVVDVEVWLVDETDDVCHPELIQSATMRLLHNGHNLLTAQGDRYNGTEDGSIHFFVLNPNNLDNLTTEVEVIDLADTVYTGHASVLIDDPQDALPRNSPHVF